MKYAVIIAALTATTGCDALRQVNDELSDGYFIGSSIALENEAPTNARFSLIALAENRSGSPARFEALEGRQFFATDFPVLNFSFETAPDGNHVAGTLLTSENGVSEFRFGLWRVDPFLELVNGTDDGWPRAIAEQCGYAALFEDQVIAQLALFAPQIDPSLPLTIEYAEIITDGGVEWETTTLGWANAATSFFEVNVDALATVRQPTDETTNTIDVVINQKVYVGLSTTAGTGINIARCQLAAPTLAAATLPVYDVTTTFADGETRFFVDGELLRLFLQPEFPFNLGGGIVQSAHSHVFVPF